MVRPGQGEAREITTSEDRWKKQSAQPSSSYPAALLCGQQVYPPEAGGAPRSDAGFVWMLRWSLFWGDVSYGKAWELAGLDCLQVCSCAMRVECIQNQVVITSSVDLLAQRAHIPCVTTTYRVAPSGDIVVDNTCYLFPALPPPGALLQPA
eukprot:2350687-Rhodomonas_salina.1